MLIKLGKSFKHLNEHIIHFLQLLNLQVSVRKTHCIGRKHKENVRDYYQKWMEEQAQRLIDQTSINLDF